MYIAREFRANMKQAFDRAIRTPIKVIRGNQVYYLLTEQQFKAMQVKAITHAIQTPLQPEPTTTSEATTNWGA